MPTLSERRQSIVEKTECHLVTADEFVGQLTSHGQWDRADQPNANLLGLRDRLTGTTIFVPTEEMTSGKLTRNSFAEVITA